MRVGDPVNTRRNQQPVCVPGWIKPPAGFVALNCDEVVAINRVLAGCRGIIRDREGNFKAVFSFYIGTYSVIQAVMGDFHSLKSGVAKKTSLIQV
jgi:hypothetical protein